MNTIVKALVSLTQKEFHNIIVNPHPVEMHGDIEAACLVRIAKIERLPLGPDGRWWHYPMAHAYPYGN